MNLTRQQNNLARLTSNNFLSVHEQMETTLEMNDISRHLSMQLGDNIINQNIYVLMQHANKQPSLEQTFIEMLMRRRGGRHR